MSIRVNCVLELHINVSSRPRVQGLNRLVFSKKLKNKIKEKFEGAAAVPLLFHAETEPKQ